MPNFALKTVSKMLSGNVMRWYGNVLNCLFLSLIDLPKIAHCSIYCTLDYCKALNSTASRQDAAAQLITGPKNKECCSCDCLPAKALYFQVVNQFKNFIAYISELKWS